MKLFSNIIHHAVFIFLCFSITSFKISSVSSFENGLSGHLSRSQKCYIPGLAFDARVIGKRRVDGCPEWRSGLYSSNSAQQSDSFEPPFVAPTLGTTITVSYAGQACNITVGINESILAALERQSTFIQSHLTALPDLPSDCRRGNCLTCAASLMWEENDDSPFLDTEFIHTQDDGLSPAMSEMIANKGYILTCSSFITPQRSAPAMRLELGVQEDVWKEVYRDRFTTAESQLTAQAAMARVLRKSAERNLPDWIRATERVLRQTEME
jgi:ferredoxin